MIVENICVKTGVSET